MVMEVLAGMPDTAALDFAPDPLDDFDELCVELEGDRHFPGESQRSGSNNTNTHFSARVEGKDIDPGVDEVAFSAPATRKKKSRSLVSARNAQRRFRERQKVRNSSSSCTTCALKPCLGPCTSNAL